ncbi:MAG: hypothetical protein ACOYK8_05190 [Alphaproteobacteria bacterium]
MLRFDLYSDLHLRQWVDYPIDVFSYPHAPLAIIAGDVDSDVTLVANFLKVMAACYQQVFYVTGNAEHYDHLPNFSYVHCALKDLLEGVNNITFLEEDTPIIEGVAFVGCSGWWDFAFAEPHVTQETVRAKFHYVTHGGHNDSICDAFIEQAEREAKAMAARVAALQTDERVNHIICVTHTLPFPQLTLAMLQEIQATAVQIPQTPPEHIFGLQGSLSMQQVLEQDPQHKIGLWLCGHFHLDMFSFIERPEGQGFFCVSHPRGRPADRLFDDCDSYAPLPIEFENRRLPRPAYPSLKSSLIPYP